MVSKGAIQLRQGETPEDRARSYCRRNGIRCPLSDSERLEEAKSATLRYVLALALTSAVLVYLSFRP